MTVYTISGCSEEGGIVNSKINQFFTEYSMSEYGQHVITHVLTHVNDVGLMTL